MGEAEADGEGESFAEGEGLGCANTAAQKQIKPINAGEYLTID